MKLNSRTNILITPDHLNHLLLLYGPFLLCIYIKRGRFFRVFKPAFVIMYCVFAHYEERERLVCNVVYARMKVVQIFFYILESAPLSAVAHKPINRTFNRNVQFEKLLQACLGLYPPGVFALAFFIWIDV